MESFFDFTKLIIETAIAPASVIAAITYLAKQFIENFFKSREKSYELKLETQLEEFKSNLENKNLRYRVKVNGIYERQANAIIMLYELIVDVELSMDAIFNIGIRDNELHDKFSEQYTSLKIFYKKNKILIPLSCEELIDTFMNNTFWSVRDYISADRQLITGRNLSPSNIDKLDNQQKAAEELSKEIPIIKSELTKFLREQLGVD